MSFLAVEQDSTAERQFLLFVRRTPGWETWCAAPSREPALASAEECLRDAALRPLPLTEDNLPAFLLRRWPSAELSVCLHTPGTPLRWSFSGEVARRLTWAAHALPRDRFALGLAGEPGRAPTWLIAPPQAHRVTLDFAASLENITQAIRNFYDRDEGSKAAERILDLYRAFLRRVILGGKAETPSRVELVLTDAGGQREELSIVWESAGRVVFPGIPADGREAPYASLKAAAVKLSLGHGGELLESAGQVAEPGWFWIITGRPALPLDRLVQAVRAGYLHESHENALAGHQLPGVVLLRPGWSRHPVGAD